MDIANTVISQYYAALAMLEDSIGKCPEELWSSDQYGNPVYQIAYHAIFYAHLYVQPAASDFTPWEKHADYHSGFGVPAYPGAPAPEPVDPYSKDELLTYVQLCREEIARIVPTLDFDAGSGFDWLPFGKLELQFYSIRHVMLHVGEIAERLSSASDVEIGWVGKGLE